MLEQIAKDCPRVALNVLQVSLSDTELTTFLQVAGRSHATPTPRRDILRAATQRIEQMEQKRWLHSIQADTIRFFCWRFYRVYAPLAPLPCLWSLFHTLKGQHARYK